MAFRVLKPDFSPDSNTHYVNIRYEPEDYWLCDFMLLQIMRNQINLRTAVVTMWCPMAAHKPGIVSIKITGKYDNEDQVFDQALEMVHSWQKENDRRGNFIFDRDPIWRRVSARPLRPRAPRFPPSPLWTSRRRSAVSVSDYVWEL